LPDCHALRVRFLFSWWWEAGCPDSSVHFRNASLKPAIQPRTLVAPATGKIRLQRKRRKGAGKR
jgi:hypothetical protein